MSDSAPIRVLIADDSARVRRAIRAVLSWESDIEIVGMAANGLDAVEMAASLSPHVILMDLSMPGLDGISATLMTQRGSHAARILIVTQYDQEEYIRRVLAAGASGYILKQSLVKELATAIRSVHENKYYFTPVIQIKIASLGVNIPSRT